MSAAAFPPAGPDPASDELAVEPGGLLDVLGVAAVVVDATGRIALWSPQAEEIFGYPAAEALGRPAAPLLVSESQRDEVLSLFERVMSGGGPWAGVISVRHRDGRTIPVEFRNTRLQDAEGRLYALGLATDAATARRVEQDLALSSRLVAHSPIGLAVLDPDLRFVLVNPAMERIDGRTAASYLGRTFRDAVTSPDADELEPVLREVLETGVPILSRNVRGSVRSDGREQVWSMSLYRLETSGQRVVGVAASVVDITDQHHAARAAARARRRLAVIADASERVGTTLDLDLTAHELADLVVPEFADIAAVDVLEDILTGPHPGGTRASGPAVFRALAVKAAYPTPAEEAADPVGKPARYGAERLVTQCARTGRPVLVQHVTDGDLPRIARAGSAAELLRQAGIHSYLAVPLRARGVVLGVLDLKRARNSQPFDRDDVLLAGELAARAAVAIDNARWYRQQSQAALALQSHLLPHGPARLNGLDVAYRYQPASAAVEVGGDWFDAIPLTDGRTALVVGDVMGSGINAAATMGQVRTAARTLAGLGLSPAVILTHLDRIIADLDDAMATCVYAVYDPRQGSCSISNAGHLPPVHVPMGRAPRLLDLPTGAPLGVGGVPFETEEIAFVAGDELVLYTDGLVETRDQDIDVRLAALTDLLGQSSLPLEETCDLLLGALRGPDDHDDVALLIARAQPLSGTEDGREEEAP
ncbi:SpoIIE family protein phosphatase [Streptomyces sp. NBC_01353]|uniref:SpoIIE family protein phosphatase n=1 Tax=Streptomyces sp. NBC_01353 TaxID=2903835 RepID=UPI002E2FF2D8|nr:SpoIIE family protein phosphatase [Streptomyces sp. NBC_01353]